MHTGVLHIIYVISKENKLLPLYPPHLKNVSALIHYLFHLTEDNIAFHRALLKFSPCCNKTLPQLGLVLDTRALAAAKLDCTNLIFVEPGAKINGQYYQTCCCCRGCYGDLQHCWRRVCLPARQYASTSCSWHSRVSAQFISPDLNPVNYCIWGMLQEHVYHISSTNPRYGQLAEASCCDMGWILAEYGIRCSWSVAKKTGTMYPCTRWSLFTACRNAHIASAVIATAIPSVCPSVCPSHAGIVSKRRHVARCSSHCQIAKCV